MALVSAIHDSKGDLTRVQNKFGPAYGPAVTYPPGITNNVEPSPNTKPGWIITKTYKDSERKSNVCVGDWKCTRCLTHNSYHEEHCHSCHNRKPIPEHSPQRYNWPYAYSDKFGICIGRNELAQEITGVIMRVKAGGAWVHQIESLQVLALQPAADSGNTNIKLPRGTIMGVTRHGYISPEDYEVSLWRTIEMDSGYNLPHRQDVDKGPTVSWYDTSTNTADGQETVTIGATIVYTIHSGYKLTWAAPQNAPYCRIVWVDVTNTDEAIQNLAHRSYVKNAFANAYSMVENLKGKARDLPEGSTYSTLFGTTTRGQETLAEPEDEAPQHRVFHANCHLQHHRADPNRGRHHNQCCSGQHGKRLRGTSTSTRRFTNASAGLSGTTTATA